MCFFAPKLHVAGSQTFSATFSDPESWSREEFVEFKGIIPELKEFTSCHWQKDLYFPEDFSPIWEFCSSDKMNNDGYKCVGVYTTAWVSTANRHIRFGVWFEGWLTEYIEMSVNINSYRHRQWNHFCWSYSSFTGTNKFYFNGKLEGEIDLHTQYPNITPPSIKGTLESKYSAFIVGQDQDGVRANYDRLQSLFGSIAELNLWDVIQEEISISMLANCKVISKGNIVAWEKENFAFYNVIETDIQDTNLFCNEVKTYIVFPQKISLLRTIANCASIGGNIVAPESPEESKKVMDILSKHHNECENKPETSGLWNLGKLIWLGIVRLDSKWVRMNYDTELRYAPLGSYTNWVDEHNVAYKWKEGCAYVTSEGKWGFKEATICGELRMCAVCLIKGTPIFTLKGLCVKGTPLEWNYYPLVSGDNKIYAFEGYKKRGTIDSLTKGIWEVGPEEAKIKINLTGLSDYPVGRLTWDWYDKTCGVNEFQRRLLIMSVCEVGTQFTCNSGKCININRRCDTKHDCNDGEMSSNDDWSDEENCEIISFPPNSYNKILPPPLTLDSSGKGLQATAIRTKVLIESINLIDTVDMRIGITLQVRMRWRDSRLEFKDVFPNEKKILDNKTARKLWIPLDYVIHSNAIIGNIYPDDNRQIFVNVMSNSTSELKPLDASLKFNPHVNHENLIYNGLSSELEVRRRFRILYNCTYQMKYYPLDEQKCQFKMKLKALNGRNVTFEEDFPGVQHLGDKLIKQFQITSVHSFIEQIEDQNFNGSITLFTIEMAMVRNYYDQIQMIFVPTFLLWFVAYMTLYVSLDDFGNRCKISVSILLILVSLLGSSRQDFPKTTYFKFIDLWFFWYILNIFLIILLHIFLENIDKTRHELKTFQIGRLRRQLNVNTKTSESRCNTRWLTKTCINRVAKFVFLLANIIFTIFYVFF